MIQKKNPTHFMTRADGLGTSKKRDVIIRYVVSGPWIWDRDAPQYYNISVAGKDAGRLY